MPHVLVNGISIYYEIYGSGEPFVLIQGMGYPYDMWFAQLPVFSQEFTTVVFDNRGAGHSGKPDEECSIRQMAWDTIGLLEHLHIPTAHILGVSMGGLIAQEIAMESPERVKKLILLSTHYGTGYWEATRSLWAEVLSVTTGKMEEITGEKLRFAVTPEFYQRQWEIINRIVRIWCVTPQPAYAFMRQFEATKKFDAKERVSQIAASTLVLSGTEDQVVPLGLARLLAEQIPNARFYEIKGAAHLAFIEKAEEVNRIILEFLRN